MRTAILAVLVACGPLCAQPSAQAVPQEFQAVYSDLAAQLARSTLTRGWDGSKYPVLFGTELIPASAYTAVLQPGYYERSVTPYLDALQSIGNVKMVKFLLHYPLLYLPFYTNWPPSGGRAAYDARLAFYKRLVADLRARGIKVMVQSFAQGFGAFASTESDTLDLAGYYRTVSFDQYIAARAEQALTICRELRPDYLNFESEPDVESEKGGQPALEADYQQRFMTNNLRLVTSIRDTLENANPPLAGLHTSLRLIIGMGSWQRHMIPLARAYAAMSGIDVIDIHVHPINATATGDYLANVGEIADIAIANGKAVGMNETWLYHESSAELGKLGAPQVEMRQNWSFFAPVDISFLTLMMNVANYKRMEYVSFSWPNIFFAYLDYEKTPGCPAPPSSVCSVQQWNAAANRAVANAILSTPVPLTPTGKAFQTLLAAQPPPAPPVTAFLAAGYGDMLAPGSLASIFGARLATRTEQASGSTLPASLGGTGATVRGSDGVTRPATLQLASPQQVNLLVPAGIPEGSAEIAITAGDGTVSRAVAGIARVAPGIFTAPGSNIAAAYVVTSGASGQRLQYTAVCTAEATCAAAPIDLGTDGETNALVLYGTGFRAADMRDVSVMVGQVNTPVVFSGAQGEFAGLDQVNVTLPPSLAGRGPVQVRLTVRGVAAKPVGISIR